MTNLIPRLIKRTDPDIPAVLALICESFAYMDGRVNPPTSMRRLTESSVRNQAESGEIWTLGSPPIACVFLTPQPAQLYLSKLAVKAERRRSGLAKLLVDHAVQRARQLNLAAVTLAIRIELAENQAAFERMGFQKYEETAHKGFDRPTACSYRKEIL